MIKPLNRLATCLPSLGAVAACLLLVSAGRADTVTLKSGARLEGTIVKRTDRRVWLDIGPDILALDVEEIDDIVVDEAGTALDLVGGDALFVSDQPAGAQPEGAREASRAGRDQGVDAEGHRLRRDHLASGPRNHQRARHPGRDEPQGNGLVPAARRHAPGARSSRTSRSSPSTTTSTLR